MAGALDDQRGQEEITWLDCFACMQNANNYPRGDTRYLDALSRLIENDLIYGVSAWGIRDLSQPGPTTPYPGHHFN